MTAIAAGRIGRSDSGEFDKLRTCNCVCNEIAQLRAIGQFQKLRAHRCAAGSIGGGDSGRRAVGRVAARLPVPGRDGGGAAADDGPAKVFRSRFAPDLHLIYT